MAANLRLIAGNPRPGHSHRHNLAGLHRLASRLVTHVRSGNAWFAKRLIGSEALTPIEMGVVGVCMANSGVTESQILDVLTGA